jgi:NADP-dependent 3-hydroxy acid dehydrogenase YdfG
VSALAGRVAWVTGAGSGIGRATAIALAAAGASVALTGRNRAALEETAAMLGGPSLVAPADVTDADAITAAHGAVVAALGEVDLLVNNAGWNVPQRHWRDLSAESVQRMVATNLSGPFLMVLAVLPSMRARRGGVLVHIASLSGTRLHVVSGPAYSATKYGARAMSASLNAEEGIHGIRSICINPGEVATPLLDRRPAPPPIEERERMVQPEDVAAAVVFCATLPPRACVTDLSIAPTDEELYRAVAQGLAARG